MDARFAHAVLVGSIGEFDEVCILRQTIAGDALLCGVRACECLAVLLLRDSIKRA